MKKTLQASVKISLSLLFIIQISFVFAQTGVKGVVLDLETVKPMEGVTLQIRNSSYGARTDAKGEFFIALPKNKDKEYVIVASMMGYDTDSAAFTVFENNVEFVSLALLSKNSVLEEVVITTRRERASEVALLDLRRQSNLAVELIGAQELSRKGVGDAAMAVSKMSSVSKQEEGSQVYVRGLGDRYNSTSLNGLPIPSNNPELKNINLDLFSTGIIDYLSVDKVYNSYIPGDFAGGNVDIATKNYSGEGMFEITVGGNTNTNVLEKWDNFQLQAGPNVSGFVNYGVPSNPRGGFNFQNSLNPVNRTPLSGNIGLIGGKSFNLENNHRLNLFATANFSNDYSYRQGINRIVAAGGEQLKDFEQVRFGYTTNSTGMLNANYVLNPRHSINYNFLFVNTSDQFRDNYYGFIRDMAENNTGIVQRGTFQQNKLFVNQLLGNHRLTDKIDVNWGASYNNIISNMPDRTQNIMRIDEDLMYRVLVQNNAPDNHRYFQHLTEDEIAFNVAGHYKLGGADDVKGRLSIGYNGRIKRRDFEDIQYNFPMNATGLAFRVEPDQLDLFYNQQNFENELFRITGYSLDFPQIYSGDQDIHAFFAQGEYRLTDKLTGTLGMRYENIKQSIYYETILDRSGTTNTFTRNGFLPNINLKYELDNRQNLRLGASRTYTLPQFKERAYFIYEDVTEVKIGNPDLYPSQDYNLDLKWELFPTASELLSVGLFGKYIVDPINEVTLASATNDISYLNTGDWGHVYGVEMEFKKDLITFDNSKLIVGANAAYMKTNQELSAEKVREETSYNLNLTYDEASFTGASDFLVNADLSYMRSWASGSDIMATIVYNYFSDRLYALGTEGKGNQIDLGVGTLDFIVRYKLNHRFGFDLGARNLLDPTYERVQQNANASIPIVTYKKGMRFSLGLRFTL